MVAPKEWAADPDALVVDLWSGAQSASPPHGCGGADLAPLARAGASVLDGFCLTTLACRALQEDDDPAAPLWRQVDRALERLQARSGLRLGDPQRPLLVTVCACHDAMGATIAGIGLNDEVVAGLAAVGQAGFAQETHRRLVREYRRLVLGLGGTESNRDDASPPAALPRIADDDGLPQDPVVQVRRAIQALSLPASRGPAGHPRPAAPTKCVLSVVQLVSGERDARSGSGIAYSRSPVTGTPGPVGEYLPRANREQLRGAGPEPLPLGEVLRLEPGAYGALAAALSRLEEGSSRAVEVEFVIESGRLTVVRAAQAVASPQALFRISSDLVDEGVIDADEALRRVGGITLRTLLRGDARPTGRTTGSSGVVTVGMPACHGAAVGPLALDAETAKTWAAQGLSPVLALVGPGPEDLTGIRAARAVITDGPALASPIATHARRFGLPCVAAIVGMTIEREAGVLTLSGGIRLLEGTPVTVDGSTGRVYEGRRDLQPGAVAAALQSATTAPDDPTALAVQRLLAHADRRRRVEVHANAETPEQARIARRLGAEGIGLLRTEHLLLGPQRELVERLVTGDGREGALTELATLMSNEFRVVLEAMDGLPVVVRLLDPPLHEFLPDLVDLSVRSAIAEERGEQDEQLNLRLLSVRRWRQTNPLLGLRGVRILTVLPEIVDAQVRALAEATLELRDRGLRPRPRIMIPLVAEVSELEAARGRVEHVVAEVARARGQQLQVPVGVMIELPRAALLAEELARSADFFSFGTNDLTQTVWGMAPDDAEASFLGAYRAAGLLPVDPFVSLDERGVGRLVRLAAKEGRAARPELGLGACGRQVEDPGSVEFFIRTGLDYLSCSSHSIPVVRLEAGRQAVLEAVPAVDPDSDESG